MAENALHQPEVAEHTAHPVRTSHLWYGFLVGLLAWKLQLMVNYAVVPYSCWQGVVLVAHLASLATLLLALSGAYVAFKSWRRLGRSYEMEEHSILGRARFMAIGGVIFSLYFGMMILAQWMPGLVLSPCDGII